MNMVSVFYVLLIHVIGTPIQRESGQSMQVVKAPNFTLLRIGSLYTAIPWALALVGSMYTVSFKLTHPGIFLNKACLFHVSTVWMCMCLLLACSNLWIHLQTWRKPIDKHPWITKYVSPLVPLNKVCVPSSVYVLCS